MPGLVADTSALVSLGIVPNTTLNPLALCLDRYDVFVPDEVIAELEEIASYDDEHGVAATAVLDRTAELAVRTGPRRRVSARRR